MKHLLLAISAISALLLVSACYPGKGMKTLGELHEFTGSWTGSGTLYSDAGSQGTPWTSEVIYTPAYDDVLMEKREIIDTGAAQPIATLSFLGWDWGTENPVHLTVGNDGLGARKEPMTRISDTEFMVTRTTMNAQGQAVVDQTTMELSGNTYTVSRMRAVDGGTPFVSFEGTYQRSSEALDVDLFKVGAQVPLSDDTNRIACMAGFYRQEGSYQGSPILGDESIELILGGHAMFINFKFEADAGDGYFGSSLTSWNSEQDRFTGFMVSNDAMTAAFEAWLSDDQSQLIYQPLDDQGRGMEDARWSANLNSDENHCLLNVSSPKVGSNDAADKGLFIKFTKVVE
ncbi:hypothetical protein [Aliiroseovarius lamellibrachiae]|uniref:hypothetical protein n=1 Tax=Aliiroseovarius lamellibrachiae TaxID=1924933 RepID=UPI001BDFB286|nr:hypothetical protein [Aliiroseovarius lamellibrachiae]MBT2131002.1 hypothetical protein [Aliiroseovarius lamellibrachiae]